MPKRLENINFKLDKKWIIIGLAIFAASFIIDIFPVAFITAFTVANTIMLAFKKSFDPPLDPELSTFAAVLITVKYGLMYGLVAAFITKFVQMMWIQKIKAAYFFMILGYMLAAVLADIFSGIGIVNLGLLITIVINVFISIIRQVVLGYSPFETYGNAISNVIFNMVLFIGFAELFLKIMI
ncbi:MAG: hypothetical protein NDI94_01770 [Candidatus Woesearchaeota archaeon]|nr:hypothetical protein [Candidatus Woesearchaeota archaeon]